MKLLLSGYHRRLWLNILPVAQEMQRRGHDVTCLYYWWRKPDNVGYELELREMGFEVIAEPWRNNPDRNRLFLAELLWARPWDAVGVAEEGQAPDRYIWPVVSALRLGIQRTRRTVPVFGFQHGFAQGWGRLKRFLCADWFLTWGPYGAEAVGNDPRFVVTGNPRFDEYDAADAEDHGYTLVIAWPRQVKPEWLARVVPEGAARCIVKSHPDDTADYSHLERPGLEIVTGRADTRELIRCASEVVTGPSTCWIEAALYSKPIRPVDWTSHYGPPGPGVLEKTLLRGGCAARIADLIEEKANGTHA